MRERKVESFSDLGAAQRRALEGVDLLARSGGVDMATLRANGHRRAVLDRLCELGLAYVRGGHGDRDAIRFDLTKAGLDLIPGDNGSYAAGGDQSA